MGAFQGEQRAKRVAQSLRTLVEINDVANSPQRSLQVQPKYLKRVGGGGEKGGGISEEKIRQVRARREATRGFGRDNAVANISAL